MAGRRSGERAALSWYGLPAAAHIPTLGGRRLDFIVIGAQKSGTSSLFQYLRPHPEILIPTGKEATYFSHDRAVAEIGITNYLANVARNTPGIDALRGEGKWGTITPHYMLGTSTSSRTSTTRHDERTVPLRIRESLPDVRLIAILRDPVARAVSHHGMLVRRGEDRRTFDEAVAELIDAETLQRSRERPVDRADYIVRGEYGRILSGYFDVFAREQILVVFTRELERDPARLLSRIQEFIGVNPQFVPDNLGERYKVGREELGFMWSNPATWLGPTSPLSPQGIRRAVSANALAQGAWSKLSRERQRRLLRPWQRLGSRTARWNQRLPANEIRANAKPSPATLARLREHYQQDGELLTSLLGATPPWLVAEAESARR